MMINLVELLMYLYYNKEKDIIYHSDSPHSDEILFCSYEENGWKQSDEISIADSALHSVSCQILDMEVNHIPFCGKV